MSNSAAGFPALDLDLHEVADRAAAYLRTAADRRVEPSADAVARLELLDGPFPLAPASAGQVIALLDELGSPATVSNAGSRYFGFVNGGALPAALAASWMVSAWDQNGALAVMSPASARLEEIAIRWTIEALGLPRESAGAVVTGATMANFSCVSAARHRILERAGWDVDSDGMFGAPPIRVVAGGEVHVSMLKALGLAGFGRARVERVPVDGQGRMLAGALPPLDARTLVCIQAGNVNTGAFDPAAEICARARDAGAWVHVDGAFGLWAAASPRRAHLLRGFELADSWATDAHKWPNSGYDCGVAVVRDASALRSAMTVSAAYLPADAPREPCHFTPEMSRRARGVELWAALRSLGREGLAGLVERTCAHARAFADGFREAGYEVLNDVEINQVLVTFGDTELTRRVIARVQKDGVCWCGGTEWQGRTAMRVSVSSWRTTAADVAMSLDAICRIARECRGV